MCFAPIEPDHPEPIMARIWRQHKIVDFEIEKRYEEHHFQMFQAINMDIILGCWKGRFTIAKEALDLMNSVPVISYRQCRFSL